MFDFEGILDSSWESKETMFKVQVAESLITACLLSWHPEGTKMEKVAFLSAVG